MCTSVWLNAVFVTGGEKVEKLSFFTLDFVHRASFSWFQTYFSFYIQVKLQPLDYSVKYLLNPVTNIHICDTRPAEYLSSGTFDNQFYTFTFTLNQRNAHQTFAEGKLTTWKTNFHVLFCFVPQTPQKFFYYHKR